MPSEDVSVAFGFISKLLDFLFILVINFYLLSFIVMSAQKIIQKHLISLLNTADDHGILLLNCGEKNYMSMTPVLLLVMTMMTIMKMQKIVTLNWRTF